jgi:hypothetical protein
MPIKPVRKIGMSRRSITGKRTTQKNTGILQFESALERDLLTILEFDDTIAEVGVQPVKIFYEREDGFSTRYTPDVMIKYHQSLDKKPVIYEVKYAAELEEKKAEYAARFNAAERYASENGYEFKIITEIEIRTDHLWNIKFLSPFRDNDIQQEYAGMILACFGHEPKPTPKAILNTVGQQISAEVLRTIWELLAAKLLYCDLNERINMHTILWKNQNT